MVAAERDSDPPNTHADPCTDLQQSGSDGSNRRLLEVGALESHPTELSKQHISEGREPQAELVGPYQLCTGSICEEVELLPLDAVLHLAPPSELMVPPSNTASTRRRPSFRKLSLVGLHSVHIGPLLCVVESFSNYNHLTLDRAFV